MCQIKMGLSKDQPLRLYGWLRRYGGWVEWVSWWINLNSNILASGWGWDWDWTWCWSKIWGWGWDWDWIGGWGWNWIGICTRVLTWVWIGYERPHKSVESWEVTCLSGFWRGWGIGRRGAWKWGNFHYLICSRNRVCLIEFVYDYANCT